MEQEGARTPVYYTRLPAVHCCFTTMYASRSWAAHVDGRWVSVFRVYNCILIVSHFVYRLPSETGM